MESIVIYETTGRLELGTFKGILFEIHRILVSNDATRDRTHQLACKNARKADVESAMETWNIISVSPFSKEKTQHSSCRVFCTGSTPALLAKLQSDVHDLSQHQLY